MAAEQDGYKREKPAAHARQKKTAEYGQIKAIRVRIAGSKSALTAAEKRGLIHRHAAHARQKKSAHGP